MSQIAERQAKLNEMVAWFRSQLTKDEQAHTPIVEKRSLLTSENHVDTYMWAMAKQALSEITAKRDVIAWWEQRKPPWGSADEQVIHEDGEDVIRMLMVPYADRMGYRQDWRP
jgi:hypothetical protein